MTGRLGFADRAIALRAGPKVPALTGFYPWRVSRGKALSHPPPALRLAPPLESSRRDATAANTAALRQARFARWSVLAVGQQGALAARRLSRSVVFFLPRVPMPFLATVARFHPDARVRCAQSSPGPSLRSGCGFRAGPCIWAPPGSFSRTAWGSREAGKTKAPTDREDPKRRQRGLLKAEIFNSL